MVMSQKPIHALLLAAASFVAIWPGAIQSSMGQGPGSQSGTISPVAAAQPAAGWLVEGPPLLLNPSPPAMPQPPVTPLPATQLAAGEAPPTAPPATAPAAESDAARAARLDRQVELQGKQIQVLQQMVQVLGQEVQKPPVPAATEELQVQTEALQSRAQQAAGRDQEIAGAVDDLRERMDAQQRDGPALPSQLKQLFLPSGTMESPLSINGQFLTGYTQFQGQPGLFETPDFSPYFLMKLDEDWLLAASIDIGSDGVSLGEAQFNWFVNDWLTVVGGRYLTPIGFFNERLDHEWINRLPDAPLMFRQVSPQISTDGLEIRGGHYLFDSPVKFEYAFYGGNGFQITPNQPPGLADVADLEAISGGPDQLNANAVGGRLGLWIPKWGLTAGASGYHNTHYLVGLPGDYDLWQFDAGWRKGDWDVRFEYANAFQQADAAIGQNISRSGLYAQVAYRPYEAANRFLSKTEFVYRYSMERFQGIDPTALDVTAFATPVDVPVDRDQHTIGVNYWFYHAMVLKFAYEINQERGLNLHDNLFMSQYVWAF